jgi:hypothetical protein
MYLGEQRDEWADDQNKKGYTTQKRRPSPAMTKKDGNPKSAHGGGRAKGL